MALEPHRSSVGDITNTLWCRPVLDRIIADYNRSDAPGISGSVTTSACGSIFTKPSRLPLYVRDELTNPTTLGIIHLE